MMSKPNWQYDETKHCGVDFSDPELVGVYDANHQKFRSYEKAAEAIVNELAIDKEYTVIDMGSGTGAFALYAAKYCRLIHAVDVSKAMIEYASQKAKNMGVENVIFHHGGFLTYKHQDDPVDAIICVAVLHHLPDFWKLLGLRRIYEMLRPDGKFYLFDVIYSSAIRDYESSFNDWVESMAKDVGQDFAPEVEATIRDEYGTFDWIMEGLLERTGFKIDNVRQTGIFGATYICSK